MEEISNESHSSFFYAEGVAKGILHPIAQRFDVLLKERGLKWADAYHEVGLNKGYASKIRRGLIIPPLWLRIKIAQFFKVDTSVIWRIPEIQSADKIKGELNGDNNIEKDVETPEASNKQGDNNESQ